MKNIIAILVFAFSFSFLSAQEIQIQEAPKTMSQGVNNALVFDLYNVPLNIAESLWKDHMKKYKGKTKREKKTKAWFTDNAKIKTMSNNTVDVYATFLQDKKNDILSISVWFDLGGAYVSSALDRNQYTSAINVMQEYKLQVDNYLASEELELQEKALKAMENDMDKLKKDNENYHKKIADAEALIEEMKQKIQTNLKAQDDKNKEIETQKVTVDRARKEVRNKN